MKSRWNRANSHLIKKSGKTYRQSLSGGIKGFRRRNMKSSGMYDRNFLGPYTELNAEYSIMRYTGWEEKDGGEKE